MFKRKLLIIVAIKKMIKIFQMKTIKIRNLVFCNKKYLKNIILQIIMKIKICKNKTKKTQIHKNKSVENCQKKFIVFKRYLR